MNRREFARLSLTAAALLPLAGTAACAGGGGTRTDGADATITLQAGTQYTQQPIRWGVERGHFAAQGLTVEFTDVEDAVTGVATGELTFAFGPTTEYLRAAVLGSPLKIVSSAFRSKGPYFLIARPGITRVEDLRGRTVGNSKAGSNLDTTLRYVLRAHGLDADRDVALVNNGINEQAYGTLSTGQVDATIIHQPFPALGEFEGEAVTLARAWDYLPEYHTGVLISGDDVIREHPDVLRRALRAYFASYTDAKANYATYVPWLQGKLKLAPEAVARAIRQEDDVWDANPDVDPAAIRHSQEIEVEVGNQDRIYDAERFIDLRFIPQEFRKPFTYPRPRAGR
ncbi:ABC transporter substrate-binding protein [Saccharopolyspora sp. NPDC047091]|uniref:ABC transporter substrate-binding protein n=1 Tax=Saccharopolyspora sp. NPDC047091 TaxID=3155924 RepID=UPI0033C969E6